MAATLKPSAHRELRTCAAPDAIETEPAGSRGESSADKVFRGIVRGLYDGRYSPGQRLIEADLTRDFKVSRGSVREALNRLTAEGIVALNLHRGAHIRSLTREEAFEIMDLLEVLIGLAARLAAQHIAVPGHRRLLQQCMAELADHKRRAQFFEFVRARNAFYRALLRIGGSGELRRVLTSVQVNLIRIQAHALEAESWRRNLRMNDYRAVADAILAGDVRRAETAARRHVRNVRQLLSRLPPQAYPAETDQRGGAKGPERSTMPDNKRHQGPCV
jgi:DNA-binding GntR family transcriptional regulator